MALPIFLQPLLLIRHYYRVLTQTFTGWLAQSSDQLFGPLEQMIVAVVITGLAINPGLLPQFHAQVPMPMAVPLHHTPVAHQALPARPQAPSPRLEHNITAPTINETFVHTDSTNPGYGFFGMIPSSWRPDPIIISLIILLISVLIQFIPHHLFRRFKESWDIFWPPWQDRSTPPRSSRNAETGSTPTPESSSKGASASARSADGSKAEARSGDPKLNAMTDEEKAKAKAMMAYEAKKAAARKAAEGGEGRPEAKSGVTKLDSMTEEEKAKRKALMVYEAKKAAAKKAAKGVDPIKGEADTKASSSDSSSSSDKARLVKPVIIAKEPSGSEPKSQSEKAREAKEPLAASSGDEDDKKGPSNSADDPLMAGDYRSLKSALKKSTKKPRQTKNIHHNHFMTMRGNRAHLVPFPHGLHPPPDQPRHSLWWKNIPKNADHMMAPPPVPKEVKDVLAGEDIEDIEAKPKAEPGKEVDKGKEDDKDKEKLKEREKEKEKAKMKAELEAREKAKAQQVKDRAGTATASVSIEPPSQPDVPVDPQVQKATWVSQAMLCLLVFYIQEQLGLVLLAFFVWQQMNITAARQSGEIPGSRQPVATATANAATSPPPSSREVLAKPREQDMPPEMKEKLARAKAEKEAKARSENTSPRDDPGDATTKRPDKGKGKEIIPDPVPSSSKSTSRSKDKGDKATPRALTSEERAAYRARAAKSSSSDKIPSDKMNPKSTGSDEPMTKEKWSKMSDEEKKRYMSEREKRKAQTAKDETKSRSGQSSDKDKEAAQREKWEKMSDEDKKRYLAVREKGCPAEKTKPRTREEEAAAKAERWDQSTDEEKQRYTDQRRKREQAKTAQRKAGEGSGLSAEEKEKL